MRLTVQTFLTLDGVMQAPFPDPAGPVEHGQMSPTPMSPARSHRRYW